MPANKNAQAIYDFLKDKDIMNPRITLSDVNAIEIKITVHPDGYDAATLKAFREDVDRLIYEGLDYSGERK